MEYDAETEKELIRLGAFQIAIAQQVAVLINDYLLARQCAFITQSNEDNAKARSLVRIIEQFDNILENEYSDPDYNAIANGFHALLFSDQASDGPLQQKVSEYLIANNVR